MLLADDDGRIVWQYGQFGVTGAGPNELDTPVQATYLPNRHVLITDQANNRIIEVSIATHRIVWQYGTTGVDGDGPDQLSGPNSAELLANGHILISDQGNNRAIEVDRRKNILATFTAGGTASIVAFASRLTNGDTLLTDSGNSRIVEVDAHDAVVWQYFTNTDPASNTAPLPTRAVRLANGDTLISDQFNDRVISVDHAGQIVANYGELNVPGFARRDVAQSGLNAPYDAKVVNDFTGLDASLRARLRLKPEPIGITCPPRSWSTGPVGWATCVWGTTGGGTADAPIVVTTLGSAPSSRIDRDGPGRDFRGRGSAAVLVGARQDVANTKNDIVEAWGPPRGISRTTPSSNASALPAFHS